MRNSVKIALLFLFFTSGISGLIYEVVWLRMFGLALGNTAYAISITLGAFFSGLAIGGFACGRYIDRITVGNWQLAVGSREDVNSKIKNPCWQLAGSRVQSAEGRIVRIYAYLELGIGASALFVGVGISYMQDLFIWVNQYSDNSSAIINFPRFFFSFALMLMPTTLMGATLPALSKLIIRQYHEIRGGVGLLYGINTFGAAIGCFMAGFYLIQTFGVNTTVYTAVVINIVIGVAVLILERSGFLSIPVGNRQLAVGSWQLAVGNPKSAIQNPKSKIPVDNWQKARSRTAWIVLFAFGLCGFTSIAYEIIWARMLSSLFLNTIYSFTAMLVAFLCGLAIGAVVVARLSKRKKDLLTMFGIIEFCIGISALLLVILFSQLPEMSSRFLSLIQSRSHLTWEMNVCVEFILSFMVMIIPCILMGMTLPLASQIVAGDIRLLGRSVGSVYSTNTMGGILGAGVAGWLLIPWIGVKFSEISISVINICIGITFLLYADNARQSSEAQGISLKKIVIPLFLVFAAAAGGLCSLADIRIWERDGKLLYYKEDSAATVSIVEERDGNRKLMVNNRYTLGTSGAVPLQKRMGYIPLLLHNNPHDALVIGMGTGITLSAVAAYESTETVTCVEVISSVVDAAQRYFAEENNMVCQNKKTEIIIEDGRNYLMLNRKRYDVIISDLFVPYHAGAGSLYSKEHFESCKERIYDNGLFCQWLPLYQMSTKEFKIICKTFSDVFPFTTLWFCNLERGLICGLIGTKHRLKISPVYLKENMSAPSIKRELTEAFLRTPEELLSLFITDETGLKSFTEGCKVNTDNCPIIEFLAPKNIYESWQMTEDSWQGAGGSSSSSNQLAVGSWQKTENSWQLAAAVGSREDVNPKFQIPKSKIQNYGRQLTKNRGQETEGQRLGINNLLTVAGIRKDALPLIAHDKEDQGGSEASRFDGKNLVYYSDAADHLISGILYYYNDMLVEAEDEYLTAWELAPDHLYLRKMLLDLSVRFYRMGIYDEAIFINEKLSDADHEIIDPFLYFYLGLAYQAKGYIGKALSSYHNAIALNPSNAASIHYNMGVIYKSQGLMEKASMEFAEAERLRRNTR